MDFKKNALKICLEIVNVLCNTRIGHCLAKQFSIFGAVFVMYPADQEFADAFTFRFRQRRIMWKPYITGMITHPNGKRSLMFAVSAFIDKVGVGDDEENLRLLHARVEEIRTGIGAVTTHFAGTLPGRFTHLRVRRGANQKNERTATVANVVSAISDVRKLKGHRVSDPVIILGGNGYIGREVVSSLSDLKLTVIVVDKNDTFVKPQVPHVLVNITTPGAIVDYIDPSFMGDTTTVLNEVYPAPHKDLVEDMKSMGVDVYHIAGVVASSLPSFPKSYSGAVPCCAALYETSYDVRIIRL